MSVESPIPDALPIGPELRVRIPDHVAHRAFPGQMVLLNFQSGQYHGLNGSAAPMLEALGESQAVAEVAAGIAARHGIEYAVAERDVIALCAKLLARGLIEPV